MALTATEQEIFDFAMDAMPPWFREMPRAYEFMGAMAKIMGSANTQHEYWFEMAEILNAVGIVGLEPDWLNQHAVDRGTRRTEGESDEALRERIRNVTDALTRPAILAAVQAIIDEDGPATPAIGMVELPLDAAYCQSLYAPALVDWQNRVAILDFGALPNTIISTAGAGYGNSGASSGHSLAAGQDGYLEWSTHYLTKQFACGLTASDANQTLADIDYGIELDTTIIKVYEGGVLRATHPTAYAADDIVRVQRDGTQITYWHGSTLIYTSGVASVGVLVADCTFDDNGGTISNATLSAEAYVASFVPDIDRFAFTSRPSNVIWTAPSTNVNIDENHLTKRSGGASWNAGAISTRTVTGGVCYCLFTTDEANTLKACGLSNGDTDYTLADIDFAIQLDASGNVEIFENGVSKGVVGTYVAGDVFRVQSSGVGGTVTYYKGDTLLYTSLATPTYPLLVDCSLYTVGATLKGVVLEQGNGYGYRCDEHPANEVILILPYGTSAETQASIAEALRQKKAGGYKGTIEVRLIP